MAPARFLCWERENTMRPMTGLNEQDRMTWIAQENGWVATPSLTDDHGNPAVESDPYTEEGGES